MKNSHLPPLPQLSGQLMFFCTQWSADPLQSDQISGVCVCGRGAEREDGRLNYDMFEDIVSINGSLSGFGHVTM